MSIKFSNVLDVEEEREDSCGTQSTGLVLHPEIVFNKESGLLCVLIE